MKVKSEHFPKRRIEITKGVFFVLWVDHTEGFRGTNVAFPLVEGTKDYFRGLLFPNSAVSAVKVFQVRAVDIFQTRRREKRMRVRETSSGSPRLLSKEVTGGVVDSLEHHPPPPRLLVVRVEGSCGAGAGTPPHPLVKGKVALRLQ